MTTVWIIEDNAIYRTATQRALQRDPTIDNVLGMQSCEEALESLDAGNIPDVVLLDIGLPGIDGIEGIGRIKSRVPNLSILILTVFEDDDKIFRAICAGASGYLLKSEPMEKVIEAIAQARNGGATINSRVASRVLAMFANLAPDRKDYGLTDRERLVLECMAKGLVRKQIAKELNLNPHTTDYIMRCIYRKLHVHGATAAVALAVRERLIDHDSTEH